MRFLKHKEFVPFALDYAGVIRVNHSTEHCSGDSDSMIVETRHDGSIFGYCHRCSKSGNYSSPFSMAAARAASGGKHSTRISGLAERSRCYKQATTVVTKWSEDARKFIKSYGISEREVVANDIRYDEEINGLFFTVWNDDSVVGYILRRFNYSGPKYINDITSVGARCFVSRPVHDSSVVVLTEDILSAIKVGRIYNAVACLGTFPCILTINYLINNFKRFIIFFDDDNKIVRKQQRVLKNTLDMLGKAHIITGVGKDPKECTNTELKEMLHGLL